VLKKRLPALTSRAFWIEKAHATKTAKRNAGQPIENKQFGEIVDSAP
jgi:hypothetical protein